MAYDRHTGATINDDLSNIKQQIREVLETPKGTRVKNRSYGSELYTLIDQPNVNQLSLDFIRLSYEAITSQVPSIQVMEVKPIFQGSKIELMVSFRVEHQLLHTNSSVQHIETVNAYV